SRQQEYWARARHLRWRQERCYASAELASFTCSALSAASGTVASPPSSASPDGWAVSPTAESRVARGITPSRVLSSSTTASGSRLSAEGVDRFSSCVSG